jgi:hypothetical protein
MAKLSKVGHFARKDLLISVTYAWALSPRKNCVIVILGAIDNLQPGTYAAEIPAGSLQ